MAICTTNVALCQLSLYPGPSETVRNKLADGKFLLTANVVELENNRIANPAVYARFLRKVLPNQRPVALHILLFIAVPPSIVLLSMGLVVGPAIDALTFEAIRAWFSGVTRTDRKV
jgi:hypothetical protein